ncbi:hypothetical protein EBU24_01570 [bacterium]|nr:hypothetical protein [bacterium]
MEGTTKSVLVDLTKPLVVDKSLNKNPSTENPSIENFSTVDKSLSTKSLSVDLTKKPKKEDKTIVPKVKAIRKETNKWHFDNKYLEFDKQWECLSAINKKLQPEELQEVCREMKRQIQNKVSSYKMQDIQKNKYDEDKFVDFNFVISLLVNKELNCFYCRERVYLFYNFVRENKQWTLERIDNNFGHNKDNVEIACLNCNIRRRTMYYERFVFTNQIISGGFFLGE